MCVCVYTCFRLVKSAIKFRALSPIYFQGDSGSSLVCKNDNETWEIAGVTSWGVTTCSGEYPGVNTRISSYVSWIQSLI